jgi:putative ABC transport system substrate-binding protein
VKRREFITLIAGTAAAWPLAARAQQHTWPVVGHMHAGTHSANQEAMRAFEQGLGQTGFVNGTNVVVEYHWAQEQYDRLPALAAELVRRGVSVIATGTPVAALAAKQATTSIPIIFTIGSDPVLNGLVASLNRPGGNMTGATFYSNLLTAKRLALLHEIVPTARTVGVLVNPKNANAKFQTEEAQEAARALAIDLVFAQATNGGEIDSSLDYLNQQNVEALLILSDSFLNAHAGQIANQALRHSFATCFAYREPAEAGGLMGYGASRTDASRQAGTYVGRVLRGARPADLPVLQPTTFEFVINMRTAKALGITVPPTMLAIVDQVIE